MSATKRFLCRFCEIIKNDSLNIYFVIAKRTGKHPVFCGPTLVHFKKDFATYHHLSSSIIGARPNLCNVLALGTDGEEALINAFKAQMWDALIHLRCTRHMEGNFRDFFVNNRYPKNLQDEIYKAIFEDGGLIDADDASEFDVQVDLSKKMWDSLHKSFNFKSDAFFAFFDSQKEDVFKNCLIKSVRIAAGLGNPPEKYYTNNNESLNNRLKLEQKNKKLSWPAFNVSLENFCRHQMEEAKRAIRGAGNYELAPGYEKFFVSPLDWNRKTEIQRAQHIKRFMSAIPSTALDGADVMPTEIAADTFFGVSREAIVLPSISDSHLSSIEQRAKRLLQDGDNIKEAPGKNPHKKVVCSLTSPGQVHVVDATSSEINGKIVCDCLGYKSIKICAHSLAVSVQLNILEAYLQWVRKQKASSGLDALSGHKALGAGKKPGSRSRKRSKAASDTAWMPATGMPAPHHATRMPSPHHATGMQASQHATGM